MSKSKFTVGSTVWYYDDFMWGLLPCTVDRPYHCRCGTAGSCTFEAFFSEDDIGKIVFETEGEAILALNIKVKDPSYSAAAARIEKEYPMDKFLYWRHC